ncbi:MAG: lantibiotic dehydratase [Pseudonocardiaceae bacterium]
MAHLAPLLRGLHEIHTRMEGPGRAEPAEPGRALRAAVIDRMRELVPVSDVPLAVDLGLDARATLPDAVAREIEAAGTVLARLASHSHGTAAWREYAERFRQRYGPALVPVAELTDPVIGLGYPAGYAGSGPERPASRTVRDERLLAYAQLAALDGANCCDGGVRLVQVGVGHGGHVRLLGGGAGEHPAGQVVDLVVTVRLVAGAGGGGECQLDFLVDP